MKNPQSKPRGDSTLKMLPDALKEALFQFLRGHTQAATLEWLSKTHGISSSASALSAFFDWYPRQGWIRQAASIADQLKAEVSKLPELKADAKTVGEIAQVSFEIMAAQNRDSKFFLDLQRERREERRLTLEREKYEWSRKSEVEKGLEALQTEIAGDAIALEMFGKLQARVLKLQEAKS